MSAIAAPRIDRRSEDKVVLEVFVGDGVRRYGEPNPSFTIEFDGFLPGDSRSDLTFPPIPAPTDGLFPNPGEYEVHFVGGTDETYTFRLAEPGTLTIKNAIQFDLTAGWNLLAFPFDITTDQTPFQLTDENGVPVTNRDLWTWENQGADSAYRAPEHPPRTGEGFWACAPETATTRWFTPAQPPPMEFDLPAGWTLFGVPFNCRFDELENVERIVSAWRWRPEQAVYEKINDKTLLLRGQGHWFFLEEEATIGLP